MAKGSKTTLAYVEWFDASYERGECHIDEITPRVELKSAGLLMREDEHTISIALDVYDDDPSLHSQGLWRYIQHIPKVNVKRIKRIQV